MKFRYELERQIVEAEIFATVFMIILFIMLKVLLWLR